MDSVGKPSIETNLYLYAENNPVNLIDPLGLRADYVWPYSWKGWVGLPLIGVGVGLIIDGHGIIGGVMTGAGAALLMWEAIQGPIEADRDTREKMEPILREMEKLKEYLTNGKMQKGKCP